jgi:hypothetical protein
MKWRRFLAFATNCTTSAFRKGLQLMDDDRYKSGDWLARRTLTIQWMRTGEDKVYLQLDPLLVPLTVRRTQFGSAGFTDLAGLSDGLKQVKEFILAIITKWT